MKSLHPECRDASHPCLSCKLAIWRAEGSPAVKIPAGWKGPSLNERARRQVAEAKANGYEPEYTGRAVLR